MSERFVIGRAGAGKTAYCLDSVVSALADSSVEGPRLILLVPEQASLQMERALIDRLPSAAAHRAEVLSFRRLAFRVLQSSGDDGRVALSATARTMALRHVIQSCGSRLQFYRRSQSLAGFIRGVGDTITEFLQESVTPDSLASSVSDALSDPSRRQKFHDLHLLYAEYVATLGSRRMDPSQSLDIALDRLSECEWLFGAQVFVDGFAGFSGQERRLLEALAKIVERISFTVLIDPEAAFDPKVTATHLFARTHRMIAELSDGFRRHGIPTDPPIILSNRHRNAGKVARLDVLERHLFDRPPNEAPPTDASVRIVETADLRTEVDFAVAEIFRHVQRSISPLRYRDIAVIVRDLDRYHELLATALRSRGVPFFMDRRRQTIHHAAVRLLMGLIELVVGDYHVESVSAILKSGFLELGDDSCDALENYVIAVGIVGRGRWTGPDWLATPRDRGQEGRQSSHDLDRVNRARCAFLQMVDPWVVSAGEAVDSRGSAWAERLRAALARLGVHNHLEQWANEAEADGDLDRAEEHRQMSRDLDEFLEDLHTTLGDRSMTLSELSVVIESAVKEWTLGLAPPMLDQVLVGSIDRSRHPEIKLALLLGCNEGVFPSTPAEDAMLNDEDRTWMEARGLALGTPRRQRILDEAMLFYVACTRPSETLIISYALMDNMGKALLPSPFIDFLQSACGHVEVESVEEPYIDRADWNILSPHDLAAHLAYEYRHRPASEKDDLRIRCRRNALYQSVRTDDELGLSVSDAVRSLHYENVAALDHTVVGSLEGPLLASVSELETYAACAFKHYGQYRLRLREREVARLLAPDIGTIHHAVLEDYIRTLAESDGSMVGMDDTEIFRTLKKSVERVVQAVPLAHELSFARDHYLVERGRYDLERVLRLQRDRYTSGRYKPRAAEIRFGMDQSHALPGLELKTPKGRNVVLRGAIDRVDLAEVSDELLGIVIDYKHTQKKRLDLSGVYHGLSLQLLGYLLVLAKHGETLAGRPITPAGALYVSLQPTYRDVKRAGDLEVAGGSSKPRGILDMRHLDAIEHSADHSQSSHYAIYRKKQGGFGKLDQTDVAEPDAFAALLRRTAERLGQLADRVIDGEISVLPHRLGTFTPCGWCALASFCRLERGITPMLNLETLTRSEVFNRLVTRSLDDANG